MRMVSINKQGARYNLEEMKQPRYNDETEAAIKEARMIMSGQKQAKAYPSAHALFAELDEEMDGE